MNVLDGVSLHARTGVAARREEGGRLAGQRSAWRDGGFFGRLPASLVLTLQRETRVREAVRGQVIFEEGDPAEGLYSVCSGLVKLTKAGPSGRQVILRLAGPGELLGYRAVLAGVPYMATALAAVPTVLCRMGPAGLQEILRVIPDAARRLARLLATDLGTAEARLLDFVDRPAEARLAHILLWLKNTCGAPVAGGIRLAVTLTRRDLADLAGMAEETAIRALSDLRRRGAVILPGHEIVLRDLRLLAQMAQEVLPAG